MVIVHAIVIVWLNIRHIPIVRKQFVDLYQALLKDKSKHVKTYATKNVLVKAKVENNNASVKKILFTHEVAKSLKISNFFKDPNSHDKDHIDK